MESAQDIVALLKALQTEVQGLHRVCDRILTAVEGEDCDLPGEDDESSEEYSEDDGASDDDEEDSDYEGSELLDATSQSSEVPEVTDITGRG